MNEMRKFEKKVFVLNIVLVLLIAALFSFAIFVCPRFFKGGDIGTAFAYLILIAYALYFLMGLSAFALVIIILSIIGLSSKDNDLEFIRKRNKYRTTSAVLLLIYTIPFVLFYGILSITLAFEPGFTYGILLLVFTLIKIGMLIFLVVKNFKFNKNVVRANAEQQNIEC